MESGVPGPDANRKVETKTINRVKLACYKIINFNTLPLLSILHTFNSLTSVQMFTVCKAHSSLFISHRNTLRMAEEVLCSHFTDEGTEMKPGFVLYLANSTFPLCNI